MPAVPAYFDGLIAGFERGQAGRFVHLGAWAAQPLPDAPDDAAAFERAQHRLNDQLLAMAALADGQRVVDVGCGFGGTLAAVDASHRGMTLLGLNIDPRQLAICASLRPAPGNTMIWLQADACGLPLADASVDRLLCIEAMFHFSSRRRFFAEAARVLAPGGVMVASDILLSALPAPAGDGDGDGDDDEAEAEADRRIRSEVQPGLGPWPDFWGADADHRALARAAGLACVSWVDAADATLPSHRHTAPAGAAARDAVGRAAATLAWLHRVGRLRYPLMRFDLA